MFLRCGRTDKGVSAFSQVISITLRSKLKEKEKDELHLELDYSQILNRGKLKKKTSYI